MVFTVSFTFVTVVLHFQGTSVVETSNEIFLCRSNPDYFVVLCTLVMVGNFSAKMANPG